MNIYEKYPDLTDGTVIIRKMSDSDADALAQFTSNAEVYRTLPTFLYELKYEDKHKVIALADEELFDTGEGILMGIYLTEDPGQFSLLAKIADSEALQGLGILALLNGSQCGFPHLLHHFFHFL